jgi:hypothetical protein
VIATQACNISTQLVRDPANAILIPHVEEIRRLRRIARRRKREAAEAPATAPETAPEAAPAPDAPVPRKS